MDEKDLRILKAIGTFKSGSPDRTTEETGISKSTVHYRPERFQEQGIIKNDISDTDFEKVGLNLTLITEAWAEYGPEYHKEVGNKLGEVSGANKVYFTLGDTDFVLVSYLASCLTVEDFISELEEIDEISRTSSTSAITIIKDEPSPLNDYELEELKAALLPDVS